MKFPRSDYDSSIVDCDKRELKELFDEMVERIKALSLAGGSGFDDAEIGSAGYRYRFADCFDGKIPETEPCFLIRGKYIVGYMAVRAWAHLYRLNGGSDPMYESAMKHADVMERWAKEYGKSADMPQQEDGK